MNKDPNLGLRTFVATILSLVALPNVFSDGDKAKVDLRRNSDLSNAAKSQHVVVACPWKSAIKREPRAKIESKADCTVVNILKGDGLKIGQKIGLTLLQEDPVGFELGTLVIVMFDDDDMVDGQILVQTGHCPDYSDDLLKSISKLRK